MITNRFSEQTWRPPKSNPASLLSLDLLQTVFSLRSKACLALQPEIIGVSER